MTSVLGMCGGFHTCVLFMAVVSDFTRVKSVKYGGYNIVVAFACNFVFHID